MMTNRTIALIKGMLLRGDDLHHIAALFGENSARIAEIKAGMPEFAGPPKRGNGKRVVRGADVPPAPPDQLPPPGPYFLNVMSERDIIFDGLEAVEEAVAHFVSTHPGEAARDVQRRYHSALAERKRELWKGRQK
jgi:hypothetical protein